MRYVRTKNNQIVDLDTMEFDWAFPRENFVKAHAVKQADTIEKLCDEFVGIIEEERFVFSNTKENELFVKEQHKYHAYKVLYGAIWTDKGLIYVAKMNKIGEFELL